MNKNNNKRKQSSLLNFFKKPTEVVDEIPNVNENVSIVDDLDKNDDQSSSKKQRLDKDSENHEPSSESCTEFLGNTVQETPEIFDEDDNVDSASEDLSVNLKDVGRFIKCDKTPEDDILNDLLTNPWTPDSKFNFPKISKKNLSFQIKWFAEFKWLVYSDVVKGALCKYCTLFAKKGVGKGEHVCSVALTTDGFHNWKHALEYFRSHSQTTYHRNAVVLAENFVSIYNKKRKSIIEQLDKSITVQNEDRKKRLVPIVETIIFCGRQCIALRGNVDSGPIRLDEPEPINNDGNFRALLRMRCNSGDEVLRNHLITAPLNATYTSPIIQNEIIDICGGIIKKEICDRVNAAKCFSVLADETTDVSGKEQMSVCVRYVVKEESEYLVREDFLDFVKCDDLTGRGLATTILEVLLEDQHSDSKYLKQYWRRKRKRNTEQC